MIVMTRDIDVSNFLWMNQSNQNKCCCGHIKKFEITFLVNLRLSFSKTNESLDSSISYLLRSLKIEFVTLTYIRTVTLTVEILQDLVLRFPLKSVIVFTFSSFFYYIPVM